MSGEELIKEWADKGRLARELGRERDGIVKKLRTKKKDSGVFGMITGLFQDSDEPLGVKERDDLIHRSGTLRLSIEHLKDDMCDLLKRELASRKNF